MSDIMMTAHPSCLARRGLAVSIGPALHQSALDADDQHDVDIML
jgi:hypothetical protein